MADETEDGADGRAETGAVRIASVQYQMRGLTSRDEFKNKIEYFVRVASDYSADFVVFPELFTMQLASIAETALPPEKAIDEVSGHTDWFVDFMRGFASSHNINIISGSHINKSADGAVRNSCFVVLRDGSVHRRDKIHPTPSEVACWNVTGGDSADIIETDRGPVGVMICYDSEFPELARHLVDQGAMILFVPFCTDDRRGYLRVRHCAHARAIENQCYVVLSGVAGNLPRVENMDIHHAESAILTPCDFAFPHDGIAAAAPPNTETIAFADLRLSDLHNARSSGAVRNLHDRRSDLYSVAWHGQREDD